MACLHTLELLSEGFFLWVPLEGGRGGDCQSSMLAVKPEIRQVKIKNKRDTGGLAGERGKEPNTVP